MSDLGGPEALSTAAASTRPRVVVLVRPRAAALAAESDADPPATPDRDALQAAVAAHAAAVEAAVEDDTRKIAGEAPSIVSDTTKVARADVAALRESRPRAEETNADAEAAEGEEKKSTKRFTAPVENFDDLDQPTERFSSALRPRKRTAEDDVIVGAVIQVDLQSDPSPLTLFLGRTLLERAARAAEIAGAPRLLLVGGSRLGDHRAEVIAAAQAGFRGQIEIHDSDPPEDAFERGRLLLLDGSALQDGSALKSLSRVGGDKVALLISDHGDGLRARTEGGAIVEDGPDLQPNDGLQLGMRASLDRLGREERLIGRVVSETHGRQFRERERALQAERYCYDALAGGSGDGLFDQWFGRHLARLVTLGLLTKEKISPSLVSGLGAVIGGAGGVLLALGKPLLALVAGLLLVVSAILDRSDGELARLRLDDRPRRYDFLLDHAILSFVLAAMAWGLDHPPAGVGGWDEALKLLPDIAKKGLSLGGQPVSATLVGVAGVAAVIALLAISAWRGPPRAEASGLERFGDMLASSFGSRDYAYLVLVGGILTLVQPGLGLMSFVLLGCTALVFGFCSLLLIVQVFAARPRS